MKQVHPNYTFVASTKTITLIGLNIAQDQLLLITNATRGVIYYNFASSSHRAVVTAGANTAVVLTDASTTGHADSDQLVIHYDDQLSTQTIAGTVTVGNATTASAVYVKICGERSGAGPNEAREIQTDNSGVLFARVTPTESTDYNPVKYDPALADAYVNVRQYTGTSVTIGSLPAISGTVTANVPLVSNTPVNQMQALPVVLITDEGTGAYDTGQQLPVEIKTIATSVTIGSLPAISGTVTANVPYQDINAGIADWVVSTNDPIPVAPFGDTLPISGTVTVGNSVAIGSLPAISGTVTANVGNFSSSVTVAGAKVFLSGGLAGSTVTAMPVVLADVGTNGGTIFSYDGTNSALNVNLRNIGGITPIISGTVTVGNSVTIGSLPAISGTVTVAAMPSGALTTRFGSVTTANTAQITSAVTNASRKYLLIQNVTTGSNVITVGIGFTPTTTQGIQLTAGAGITFESSYIPTGAIYILSSVTASNFTILEA